MLNLSYSFHYSLKKGYDSSKIYFYINVFKMSAAVLSRKNPNTVKHGYSERIYNKLTLTAKLFSFP